MLNRIKSPALITLFILGCAASAATDQVNLLWKARGLQAMEKLKAFRGKKELSKQEKCELEVEVAYALFVDPVMSKNVAVTDDTTMKFSLAFSESHAEATQLSFMYKKGAAKPYVWRVELLAKGWVAGQALDQELNGPFLLHGECLYTFDPSDPLTMGGMYLHVAEKKKK